MPNYAVSTPAHEAWAAELTSLEHTPSQPRTPTQIPRPRVRVSHKAKQARRAPSPITSPAGTPATVRGPNSRGPPEPGSPGASSTGSAWSAASSAFATPNSSGLDQTMCGPDIAAMPEQANDAVRFRVRVAKPGASAAGENAQHIYRAAKAPLSPAAKARLHLGDTIQGKEQVQAIRAAAASARAAQRAPQAGILKPSSAPAPEPVAIGSAPMHGHYPSSALAPGAVPPPWGPPGWGQWPWAGQPSAPPYWSAGPWGPGPYPAPHAPPAGWPATALAGAPISSVAQSLAPSYTQPSPEPAAPSQSSAHGHSATPRRTAVSPSSTARSYTSARTPRSSSSAPGYAQLHASRARPTSGTSSGCSTPSSIRSSAVRSARRRVESARQQLRLRAAPAAPDHQEAAPGTSAASAHMYSRVSGDSAASIQPASRPAAQPSPPAARACTTPAALAATRCDSRGSTRSGLSVGHASISHMAPRASQDEPAEPRPSYQHPHLTTAVLPHAAAPSRQASQPGAVQAIAPGRTTDTARALPPIRPSPTLTSAISSASRASSVRSTRSATSSDVHQRTAQRAANALARQRAAAAAREHTQAEQTAATQATVNRRKAFAARTREAARARSIARQRRQAETERAKEEQQTRAAAAAKAARNRAIGSAPRFAVPELEPSSAEAQLEAELAGLGVELPSSTRPTVHSEPDSAATAAPVAAATHEPGLTSYSSWTPVPNTAAPVSPPVAAPPKPATLSTPSVVVPAAAEVEPAGTNKHGTVRINARARHMLFS